MFARGITAWLLQRAAALRYPYAFAIAATLFLIDLAVPDFVPLVDELVLGLITLGLANLKKRDPPSGPSAPPLKRRG